MFKTIEKVIRMLICSIVGSITYLDMIFHECCLFAITSKLKVNVPNDIEITFYSIKDLFDVGTLFISSILHFLNNLHLWDRTRLFIVISRKKETILIQCAKRSFKIMWYIERVYNIFFLIELLQFWLILYVVKTI